MALIIAIIQNETSSRNAPFNSRAFYYVGYNAIPVTVTIFFIFSIVGGEHLAKAKMTAQLQLSIIAAYFDYLIQ